MKIAKKYTVCDTRKKSLEISYKVSPDFKVVSKLFLKQPTGRQFVHIVRFQIGVAVRWLLDIVIKSQKNNICNKGKFAWQKNFYTT